MKLAMATDRPEHVLGLHFFNPVPVMRLVELIPSIVTSSEVADRAEDFIADTLGKRVIRSQDRAGFIVNALFVPYVLAAIRMLESGFASADDIDAGMVEGCSHPMGPLAPGRPDRARHHRGGRRLDVLRVQGAAVRAAAAPVTHGRSRAARPQVRARVLQLRQVTSEREQARMSDPLVLVESRPDGVTLLRLNRPPLNPLSTALLRELEGIAGDLTADASVKAVVVTGGEKAFAAGADVSEFTADGAAPVISAGIRAGLDALGGHPAPGDRRHQRVRPRRRAGAGAGVRPARRRRLVPPRFPRDPARHLPRWGWHAARDAAHRPRPHQGAGLERPSRARRRGAHHRARRPRRPGG